MPPAQSTQNAAPVVGHWLLDSPEMNEHLRIESDGTFTEDGGPPLAAGSLSPFLSSGNWVFVAPMLTFDDARTGAHAFDASIDQSGSLLLEDDLTHHYRFSPEP